jgi:hypothetical protein
MPWQHPPSKYVPVYVLTHSPPKRGAGWPRVLSATLVMGLACMNNAVAADADKAPFGLSWGPVTSVPRPSMADREGNVTALFYFDGQAPASGPDTQQVVLEVCRDEGLQQVIWVSQPFPEAELAAKYAPIYREGVRRHGEPLKDPRPDTVLWPTSRTRPRVADQEPRLTSLQPLRRLEAHEPAGQGDARAIVYGSNNAEVCTLAG